MCNPWCVCVCVWCVFTRPAGSPLSELAVLRAVPPNMTHVPTLEAAPLSGLIVLHRILLLLVLLFLHPETRARTQTRRSQPWVIHSADGTRQERGFQASRRRDTYLRLLGQSFM